MNNSPCLRKFVRRASGPLPTTTPNSSTHQPSPNHNFGKRSVKVQLGEARKTLRDNNRHRSSVMSPRLCQRRVTMKRVGHWNPDDGVEQMRCVVLVMFLQSDHTISSHGSTEERHHGREYKAPRLLCFVNGSERRCQAWSSQTWWRTRTRRTGTIT